MKSTVNLVQRFLLLTVNTSWRLTAQLKATKTRQKAENGKYRLTEFQRRLEWVVKEGLVAYEMRLFA